MAEDVEVGACDANAASGYGLWIGDCVKSGRRNDGSAFDRSGCWVYCLFGVSGGVCPVW